MQHNAPASDLIEQGVAALHAGEPGRARTLLLAAVRADAKSAQAWLWLSGTLSNPAQQRDCLQRALAIDPHNKAAQRGLAALQHAQTPLLPSVQQPASAVPLGPRAIAPQRPSAPAIVNPWLTIWTQPRAALEWAIFARNSAETALLGALGGVSAMLAWAATRNLGDETSLGEVLAIVLLGGPPLGLAGLVLGGVLLRTGGRWIGGRGGAGAVRAGLAWAAAPGIVGLLLWAGQVAALPVASFSSATVSPRVALVAVLCGLAHGFLGVWSAWLSLVGVAAAHGFSLRRAVLAWVLAALIVMSTGAAIFFGSAFLIGLRGG